MLDNRLKTQSTTRQGDQARAEGGAVGAWAPAPFPLDAQSALLSRQLLFFFL